MPDHPARRCRKSADIGVVQGGRCFSLAPETLQSLAVLSYVFGQELESDEAVQARVFGLVHDTHPAATELLDDAVVRDGLANH
jgi:hypothetical protein